ncbi:MAG: hypothetical protein R3264_12900, partial [Anaerolineae bacterium]|nr:hypothetical protein [Anaerolineae bacterium]
MEITHCPTCGAENDAEAQNCVECGTPRDMAASPEDVSVDHDRTRISPATVTETRQESPPDTPPET